MKGVAERAQTGAGGEGSGSGAGIRRRTVRRALTLLSGLLAAAGVAMLAYPFFTDAQSSRVQSRLREELESLGTGATVHPDAPAPGRAVTRILIPRIGIDTVVVEGTDLDLLQAGAGHYSHTPLPCERGNVAIAGHRTTYGKPFERVDELLAGDEIVLVTPFRRCTYRIVDGPADRRNPRQGAAAWITSPDDWAVVGPVKGSFLTLTTCHPKGSAARRLIVRAALVS